jgi:hypothetical protein
VPPHKKESEGVEIGLSAGNLGQRLRHGEAPERRQEHEDRSSADEQETSYIWQLSGTEQR